MPRTRLKLLANLSDRPTKQRLMTAVGVLQGVYNIDIRPADPRRSNPQNRYLHGVVIPALMEFLNDPGHGTGETFDDEQCKALLVTKCLGVKHIIHPATGEVVGEVRRSTAGLSIPEFADMIDRAVAWLGETFGIEVPAPDLYYERKESNGSAVHNGK